MKYIRVFSDFACPFCYIGFSIADRLRKEGRDAKIVYYPYELDPTMSLAGGDIKDSISEEQLETAYKRIEGLGEEYGLIYNNKTKKFNTNRLHKAAIYADSEGKFFDFAREAFRAVFEFGRNVADPDIVNDIAMTVGLDTVKMNEEINGGVFDQQMEEARRLSQVHKIESVPTFIVEEDGVKGEKHVTTLKDYESFKKDLLD